MRRVNRRAWMTGIGAAAVAASAPPGIAGDEVGGASGGQAPAKAPPLLLTDFQPRSMLHVTETTVEKPRFPVVDAHTHLCSRGATAARATRPHPRNCWP